MNSRQLVENASNIKHPKHLGLGGYPPNLYGWSNEIQQYNEDMKSVMKKADGSQKMPGLKFPSYDVNNAIGEGHNAPQKVVYI